MRRAVALAAMIAAAPASAEEVYFRGFGQIFSAGVCWIGPGRCTSYLMVEREIEDLCQRRPSPIFVAGHSMGGSAAMRLVHGLDACGVKVNAAAFLDPMAHPYDMPAGTKTLTFYSAVYAGTGEGKPGSIFIGGSHIGLAFNGEIRARIRALFDKRAGE